MAQVRAWNIPLPLTSFTNRTSELVDIGTLMMRGHGRALVIYGMGGVGKTQLALTYAHRSRQTLSVGWLVPAASRAQAMASLSELARALGFIDTHQRATVAALLSYLNGRDGWLLIFDDGREVSDLIGLLPTSPGGRVLITSRDPQFDQLADALMLQPFPTGEATSFLLRRSGDVDAEEAGHIAAEMGGLPLALEQIGAYCRDTGISLQAYHNRLRTNRRRLLEVGAPAARMNVQLTVRLAVKRARRQFRPSHRLLRQLSVLASADVPRAMLE